MLRVCGVALALACGTVPVHAANTSLTELPMADTVRAGAQVAQAAPAPAAAKAASDQLMARQTFQFPLGEWLLRDVTTQDMTGLYSTVYSLAHPAAVGQIFYGIAKGDYIFGDLVGTNAQADWLNRNFASIGTVTGRQLELVNNALGGTRVAFLKSKQGQNCAYLFSYLGERDQLMGVMCSAPTLPEPAFQELVRTFAAGLKRIS